MLVKVTMQPEKFLDGTVLPKCHVSCGGTNCKLAIGGKNGETCPSGVKKLEDLDSGKAVCLSNIYRSEDGRAKRLSGDKAGVVVVNFSG